MGIADVFRRSCEANGTWKVSGVLVFSFTSFRGNMCFVLSFLIHLTAKTSSSFLRLVLNVDKPESDKAFEYDSYSDRNIRPRAHFWIRSKDKDSSSVMEDPHTTQDFSTTDLMYSV